MNPTLKQVRAVATQLLEREGIAEPPVPVERLAKRLGARLRYEPFDGELSGLLHRMGEEVVIGINSLHPRTRQRFTVAHEIAHLLLHEHQEVHLDRHFRTRHRDEVSALATDEDEKAANAFAAELLVPAGMLAQDLRGYAVDHEDDEMIRRLAERYKVSVQAMVFRLTNLGFLS